MLCDVAWRGVRRGVNGGIMPMLGNLVAKYVSA